MSVLRAMVLSILLVLGAQNSASALPVFQDAEAFDRCEPSERSQTQREDEGERDSADEGSDEDENIESYLPDAKCETENLKDGLRLDFGCDASCDRSQTMKLVGQILGYVKWFAGFAGVGGFFLVAIKLMVDRRNRSAMVADSLTALMWICAGLVLLGLGTALAQEIVDTALTASTIDS